MVERDRETNARSLAETEFLARELADLRLELEHKADRDDLVEPIERLTQAIERLHGRVLLLAKKKRVTRGRAGVRRTSATRPTQQPPVALLAADPELQLDLPVDQPAHGLVVERSARAP